MAFHTKPFRVWFNKIHGFIKIYDVTRYLVILGPSWFDEICNSFKYLINEKKGIADSISYNLAIIRLDSYNSFPIEKILSFHNVIILVKSIVNKNKSEHYYSMFLEKGSFKDKSNTRYFQINVFML